MSYNPPQVEVTQVQKTVSPSLISPDLVPAVVGPAFHVEVLDSAQASPYTAFNGSQTTITLDGIETGMVLDSSSVYVDLVMDRSGTAIHPVGSRLVISSGLTFNNNQVILPANAGWTGASIYIGYRALRDDLAIPMLFESLSDVIAELGDVSTMNPLGLALVASLNNGNAATYAYGTVVDDYSGTACSVSGVTSAAASHALALEEFSSKEVYVLAPATYDKDILSTYKTHVNAMSVPTEKRERIVIGSPIIPWVDSGTPSADKATTALAISTAAAAISEKRVVSVFPDVAFIRERRHVSTLKPAYVAALYENGYSTTVNAYLDQRITFSATNTETAYQNYSVRPAAGVGEEITSALWAALLAHAMETGDPFFYAYIPIPSSVVLTPSVAGQIAGNPPQQPLTNLSLAGVSSVKFSSDWFSESQLNTIAQGGNYILKQAKPSSAIVCRHQLSTNMGSIEAREISITKTVDYTAKFVRNTVTPFIGKYIINKSTLDMINFAIKGAGEVLVRDGILNDFKVSSVAQDTVSKDTVLVSISILPPYPVNYIKIELIF